MQSILRSLLYSLAVVSLDMFLVSLFTFILDDMLIKLWNWEKNWVCQQVFEGHTHYVMEVKVNPKDNNTFASAS